VWWFNGRAKDERLYDAVSAAGMSFPFPQREVRLLSDQDGGTPMVPFNAVDKKT
jgi:hypothetical protein